MRRTGCAVHCWGIPFAKLKSNKILDSNLIQGIRKRTQLQCGRGSTLPDNRNLTYTRTLPFEAPQWLEFFLQWVLLCKASLSILPGLPGQSSCKTRIIELWKFHSRYINNNLHLARKYFRIFVRGHHLIRDAKSFREWSSRKTASFEEKIMFKNNYTSTFLCQMETKLNVFIILFSPAMRV